MGAVGNIRPAKDYSTLLRAAQLVCNDFSGDVQFEIAGEGSAEDVEALQALRNTLGLQANVSFVGFVPDVRAFLRSLDVFVSSSVTEGLPLAVLEAAGAACPIVATRCGGNEEVLAPAGDDSLVPPRNPEVLARAIVSALADPHRARRSAVRVAKQVRARFSIEQMIRGYSKLYQQVIRS